LGTFIHVKVEKAQKNFQYVVEQQQEGIAALLVLGRATSVWAAEAIEAPLATSETTTPPFSD
jgi:hypothetical protein